MSTYPVLRIHLECLSSLETLSEEEQAKLLGSGPHRILPSLETLETRELLAGSLLAALDNGILNIEPFSNEELLRVQPPGDLVSGNGLVVNVGQGVRGSAEPGLTALIHPNPSTPDNIPPGDRLNEEGVSLARTVLFLDPSVPGVENLVERTSPSVQVVLLSADRDGIEQIAEVLAGQNRVRGVHVVSHATQGQLRLGNTVLSKDNLDVYAPQWEAIRAAMVPHADFLLYGCDLAQDQAGQTLVDGLSQRIGVDVAASTDPTGAASLGGDWVLEYRTGAIETPVLDFWQTGEVPAFLLATSTTQQASYSVGIDPQQFRGTYSIVGTSLTAQSGVGSISLNPGDYQLRLDGIGYLAFKVEADGTISTSAAGLQTDGNTLRLRNATVHIDPRGYAGPYLIDYASTTYATVARDTVVVPGLGYTCYLQGIGRFAFTVDAHGNVSTTSPCATAAGNALTLNNATVHIDPRAYAGPYLIDYASTTYATVARDTVVVPGLGYTCYLQGIGRFAFTVDAQGNVSTTSPCATAAGNALTLNNTTVRVDPQGCIKPYTIAYARAAAASGVRNLVVVPGFSGYQLTVPGVGNFSFGVDAAGQPSRTAIPVTSAGTTWTFQLAKYIPNQPPVMAPVADQTLAHDRSLQVSLQALDPDNDQVSFTAEVLGNAGQPLPATVTLTGSNLNVTPAAGFTGTFQVRVTASDGQATDTRTFLVTVTNSRPVLAPLADVRVRHDQGRVTVSLQASDAEGDPLAFAATVCEQDGTPRVLPLTIAGETLIFSLPEDLVGTFQVRVTAGDGIDQAVQSFNLTRQSAIDDRYQDLGGSSSFLGQPLGIESDLPGGGRIRFFERGVIRWTPEIGAQEMSGGRILVDNQDVQSFAVAPDGTVYTMNSRRELFRTPPGGARVGIDNQVGSFSVGADGALYVLNIYNALYKQPPGSGGWVLVDNQDVRSFAVGVDGAVYIRNSNNTLLRVGGNTATTGVGWMVAEFDNAAIFQNIASGEVRVVTVGNLYQKYLEMGGWRTLGVPRQVDTESTGSGWVAAEFEHAAIFQNIASGEVRVVTVENLYQKYLEMGGWRTLGVPRQVDTEDVVVGGKRTGWVAAEFEHAAIFQNIASGEVRVVTVGNLYQKYLEMGGWRTLGVPRQVDTESTGSGWVAAEFEHAAIFQNIDGASAPLGTVRIVPKDLYQKYLEMGGWRGLGVPTADKRATLDGIGEIAYFQNGAIYWSQSTGAVGKAGVLQLSPAHQALFSADYLKFREHFLTLFLWDGMVAKYVDPQARKVAFGDQGLHMGYALEMFANEAALFRRAGLDSAPADRIIQQLLNGFDRMRQGAAGLFGTPVSGYFLRDVVSEQNRHGIPTGWTIESDFDQHSNWEQTKIDTEVSQDQALHLFMGWQAVVQNSGNRENVQRAWEQCASVMQYLTSSGWEIKRPDGVTPTDNHNAGDFRYFAGFFSKIADQITGSARAILGSLPGMRSYYDDSGNTIRITLQNRDILAALTYGQSVVVEAARTALLGSGFGEMGTTPIDVPVSVIHELILGGLTVTGGTVIGLTGNVGLNLLLPYLPQSVVGVSVRYPTLEETTWWMELYPGVPKVSTTGVKEVWHTVTVGDLLRDAGVPMSGVLGDLRFGAMSVWNTWGGQADPTWSPVGIKPYAMHLLLTALAFDPDVRAGVLLQTLAPAMNDPWCLLLRANVLGQPVSGGILSWARTIHSDSPALTLGENPTGQWVSTNRWEWATNYQTGSSAQITPGAGGVGDPVNTEYNRLDFLSLEGLLRLLNGF